jgi:hypothetical protein
VPGFAFARSLLAHAWQCGAVAQASAGDRWRRRYEGVFSLPAGCERMTLATAREKSAGFRRICPELSAFESVD